MKNLSESEIEKIRTLREKGWTYQEICRKLEHSLSTVSKYCFEQK